MVPKQYIWGSKYLIPYDIGNWSIFLFVYTGSSDNHLTDNQPPDININIHQKSKLHGIVENTASRSDREALCVTDTSDVRYNYNRTLGRDFIYSRPICHTSEKLNRTDPHCQASDIGPHSSLGFQRSRTLNTRRKQQVVYDLRNSNFKMEAGISASNLRSDAQPVTTMNSSIITDDKFHSFASDGPSDPEVL